MIETLGVTGIATLLPVPVVIHLLSVRPGSAVIFFGACALYGAIYLAVIVFCGVIFKKGPMRTLSLIAGKLTTFGK
jgi:hypothetical protein